MVLPRLWSCRHRLAPAPVPLSQVDDLLNVSRASSGKIALSRDSPDLRDIDERAVAAFREAGRIARHELEVSGKSAVVYGDPTRLEQIVWNLVASSAGPGKGEFTVRFPVLTGSPSDAPRPADALPPRPRRILVVEDNPDAREALALLLESWGHHVEQAGDGLTGLEVARARPPDVALVDVGLPGIDGYTLAQELRATPACAAVRLIALTGYSRSSDRERGHEAGFDAYLVKPVDPDQLRQALSHD